MIACGKTAIDPSAIIMVRLETSGGVRFLRLRLLDGSEVVFGSEDYHIDGILDRIKVLRGWEEINFPEKT